MIRYITTLAAIFFLLDGVSAHAAPIGATAVDVTGRVEKRAPGATEVKKVRLGTSFREGDRVSTGPAGMVEIVFDNGNQIRLDKGGALVIASLRRDTKGSAFSIFKLTSGRVASKVGKLPTTASKFAFHTPDGGSVGVTGTPPFVVSVGAGGVVDVFLLGNPGEHGSVLVTGSDGSTVSLTPGTRTTIPRTGPPAPPAPIPPAIAERMQKNVANLPPPPPPGPGLQQNVSQTMSSQQVTTPVQPAPGNVGSPGGTNSSTTTDPSGQGDTTEPPPLPARYRFEIKYK